MEKTLPLLIPKDRDPNRTAWIKEERGRYELKAGLRFGECVICEPLGRGGLGEVYRADNETLAVSRAIKILQAEHCRSVSLKERFLREARIAASLNHPGIVGVHSVGEAHGRPYIEMEYIDGPSVRHLLQRNGALPIPVAITIAVMAAEALDFAHHFRPPGHEGGNGGIVHRDIKPENLLISSQGRVKIVDFGLAKTFDNTGETLAGAVMGTLSYMPPEQIDGKRLDGRADLFALSVVLYEMVAGHAPFAGETATSVIRRIVSGDYPPLKLRGKRGGTLAALIRSGLSSRIESRPQQALLFIRQLRYLQKEESDVARIRLAYYIKNPAVPQNGPTPSQVFTLKRSGILLLLIGLLAIGSAYFCGVFKPVPVAPKKRVVAPGLSPSPQKKERPLPPAPSVASEAPSPVRSEHKAVTVKKNGPVDLPAGLAAAKRALQKGDTGPTIALFEKVKVDTRLLIRAEAEYYLLIMGVGTHHGPLRPDMRSEFDGYLRRYSREPGGEQFVKDVKRRLLLLLEE